MTATCRAVLFGATGLIGTQLLQHALADETVILTAVSRKPLAIAHPRLDNLVISDFSTLNTMGVERRFDVAFSCLGSTLEQAGSKAAFYAIDHDLVLDCARWAQSRGARHLLAVSSVGVGARSPVFYNRVKADTERDLAALGYERLSLMQPSLLLGERTGPVRPAEAIASKLMPLLSPFMLGSLRDYRAIPGRDVARAMLARAKDPGAVGIERLRWRQMQPLLS